MTAALGIGIVGTAGTSCVQSTITNHTVDASNEGIAWRFMSETSDAITGLFFRYGARTGTPPTYRVSLQSLDTSGNPSGTILGGGTPASATFTPPADATWDGTGRWITLDNSYTPTLGQTLAIVVDYSSGTIDASNNSSFTRLIDGSGLLRAPGLPNHLTNSGGTWTAQTNVGSVFGYKTASARYGNIVIGSYTTSTGTSGHRSCGYLTIPSGFASTFTITGLILSGRGGAAAGTLKAGVWNAAGTQLAITDAIDCDAFVNVTSQVAHRVTFNSAVTLNYGTKYYYGWESTGSNCCVNGATLSEADDRLAYPLGTNCGLATWNGSAWTETDTIRPLFDLIFSDITAPSGTGGAYVIGG